jgi:hypothetical protein
MLLDVPDASLSASPLGIFQAVRPIRDDYARLVRDLAGVLTSPATEGDALARFETTFDNLLSELDGVPGSGAHDFLAVLVLPDRVLPVPNSAPSGDEEWASVMARITALQSISGMNLARYTAADLECLDLEREEWIRAPRLASRLATRRVALVHRTVAAKYEREAKFIAKGVKEHLAKLREVQPSIL